MAPGQGLFLITRRDQLLHVTAAATLVSTAGGRGGMNVVLVFDPAAGTFLVVGAELRLQVSSVQGFACGGKRDTR